VEPLWIERMFDSVVSMTSADVADSSQSDDPTNGSFAALLDRLGALVPLLDGGIDSSTIGERQHAALELAETLGRVEAALTTVAGVGSDRLDHARDGIRSMPQWLCGRTELDRSRTMGLQRLHDSLKPVDSIRDAWCSGQLGTAKVKAMLKSGHGLTAELVRDQDRLIERIAPLRASWAAIVMARWREAVLAERDESPDDRRPTDQPVNSLRFSAGIGNETNATTILDPLHAAEIRSLLDAEIDRRFRTGTYTSDDGMTLDERRLDAQMELMRRGSLVETEGGEAKKHVILLVDIRHLDPNLDVDAIERALWPCETADGTRVSPQDALDTICGNASVTAVLGFYGIGGRFRPIGETTTARLATPSQRRLLKARDRGCMFPGCDTPASRTKAHHEPPYEQTKRTTTDELVLLCRFHHRCRHEEGFAMTLDRGGDLTVHRPDGTPLPEPPPGHKLPPPSDG
jgi:hypothetical protein